jgi:hypothetical protein
LRGGVASAVGWQRIDRQPGQARQLG